MIIVMLQKPLMTMVTTPEMMMHPVAPMGVAWVEPEAGQGRGRRGQGGQGRARVKREKRQRSHWQTREGRCRLQQ